MGKTHRRNCLDLKYGCFEDYRRRSSYAGRFGLHCLIGDEEYREWDYLHDKKQWDRRRRDGKSGHYNYRSGGNQHYRQLTNDLIRSGTRQAIHRGMRSGEWDDLIWPTDWDGKQFIWSVW
jgi:hypothetical protein